MKGSCFFAMLGGMVLGSVITMLAAPKSGDEMRDSIREMVNREIEKVRGKLRETETKAEEHARK